MSESPSKNSQDAAEAPATSENYVAAVEAVKPVDEAEDKLDRILVEIGEFQLPQLYKYLLLCVPIALCALYSTSFMVTATNIDYRCRIPECDLEGTQALYETAWVDNAIPSRNGRLEKCLRYRVNKTAIGLQAISNGGQCMANVFDRSNAVQCSEYVFKTDEYRLIRQFAIYCEENEYKLALVGTINNIGAFLLMPLTGILSDRFGRLTVLVIGSTLNSIFGLLKAFSTSYMMFMMFEFLDSAAGTCTYMAAFVLGVEWVSSKYRVLSCTAISLFYPVGEIVLGLLAMHIPHMRTLLIAVYVPGLIVITYYWLVPESVRWLMVTGRIKRARQVLHSAAAANNKILSPDAERIIDERAIECPAADKDEANLPDISVLAILKSPVLALRLCICSIDWIVCYLVFYGLALSATVIEGDDNKYLSFIVVVVAELPGSLFTYLFLDRLGRRRTLCAALTLAGCIILCSQFIDEEEQTMLTRVFFFAGMCAQSCAFTTTYIYTAEIWPTSLRNTMMNVCSSMGRFGAMAAPFSILLSHVFPELPFIVYGLSAIITGLLILLLPETHKKVLPDTIEDAIAL